MWCDFVVFVEFGEEIQSGFGLWDQFCDKVVFIVCVLCCKIMFEEFFVYWIDFEVFFDYVCNVIDGFEIEEMNINGVQFEC